MLFTLKLISFLCWRTSWATWGPQQRQTPSGRPAILSRGKFHSGHLKTPAAAGKNTGHVRLSALPLEGGAESWPGEGCSAELSPCGPAGKPVRRYLNLPCSDSLQDQNKSCRWAASLLSGLGSGWCCMGCSAPPEQELMEEKIPDGETAIGAGTPCPR